MKISVLTVIIAYMCASCGTQFNKIDRKALVERNNPEVTKFDPLSSLTVGNGKFAVTVDATGLQTFPEFYSSGVPLGTQSHWGWHSFLNVNNYRFEETLERFDFGHSHPGLYAVQLQKPSGSNPVEMDNYNRRMAAVDYFRANPHRLH